MCDQFPQQDIFRALKLCGSLKNEEKSSELPSIVLEKQSIAQKSVWAQAQGWAGFTIFARC